jgi:hypothetical protein
MLWQVRRFVNESRATRAISVVEFTAQFRAAMAAKGPQLIEAVIV